MPPYRIVEGYVQLANTQGLTAEKAAALRAEADKARESIRTRGVLDIHTLETIAEPIRDRRTPQPRRMSARDDALRIVLSYLQLAKSQGVTQDETSRLYAAANNAIESVRTSDVLNFRALEEITDPIRDRLNPLVCP